MEFDSRRLGYPVVDFVFSAPQVFLHICFVIGSDYFIDLVARYLFRTARYNLSFAEACSAAVVIVSFLLAPGSSARDLWSAEGSGTLRI